MVRPTINSEKHLVQVGIDVVTAASVKNIGIAIAKQSPSASFDVRVGAVIKAVYVEMWVQADAQNIGSQTIILEKIVGDGASADFSQMADLHNYPNKKNILYTTQGLTGESDTNPIPVMRGWYKIPKGKQRMGLGDKLQLTMSANLQNLEHCGMFIFKEYF